MNFCNKYLLEIIIFILTEVHLAVSPDSPILYSNPCESNPCEGFGICRQVFTELPGYNCACNQGYSQTPYNITSCDDINECLDTNLCGNFTCENQPGRYRCICGQNYTGLNCSIARNKPNNPVFNYLTQNRVILAGGTRVTVGGENLNIYPILGVILTNSDETYSLFAKTIHDHEDSTCFDIIIPSAPISLLDVIMTVNVLYYANDVNITADDYINTLLTITYVQNPVIDLLFPTTILADGGITIYGSGSGFDIINEIILYVNVKIYDDLKSYLLYEESSTEKCYPEFNKEGKVLRCIWPNLNLTQILPKLSIIGAPKKKKVPTATLR